MGFKVCVSACLLLLFVPLLPAFSCRYSIRDVGFTVIRPAPYELVFRVPPAFDPTIVKSFETAAHSVFFETNVEWKVEPDLQDGREVELVLGSPEGEMFSIRLDGLPADPAAWDRVLSPIVTSSARETFLQQALESYAAVLFVEGTDPGQNEVARRAVEKAVEKTLGYMKTIPKPVERPPRVIRIPRDDFPGERVLLWSLGMDPDETGPQVAVLYGRGRLIGSVLAGTAITTEGVYRILTVIGLDCECDLDRSWVKGVRIPLRWTDEIQQRAVKVLGFDPESPLVKIEVSQILSQGAGSGTASGGDPLLGYSEGTLSFVELEEPEEGEEETTMPGTPTTDSVDSDRQDEQTVAVNRKPPMGSALPVETATARSGFGEDLSRSFFLLGVVGVFVLAGGGVAFFLRSRDWAS